MATSTDCTRNAVGSGARQKTLITGVHSARELCSPQKEVQVEPDKLEMVASFWYLGDMLSAAYDCEFFTTTCVKTSGKKFGELLPPATSLSRHKTMCAAPLCRAQCSMPVKLAHYQINEAKHPASAAK